MPSRYKRLRVGKKKTRDEHRVVAERILGITLRPDQVVHHIDGDGRNNDPANLQVMTREEHGRLHVTPEQRERFKDFPKRCGSGIGNSKLVEEAIPFIRRWATQFGPEIVARWFGVDERTIRHVRDRATWRHVTIS